MARVAIAGIAAPAGMRPTSSSATTSRWVENLCTKRHRNATCASR